MSDNKVGTKDFWGRFIKFADVLEKQTTGDESTSWTAPNGETGKSFLGYVKDMFENGGLPATPFSTYDEMVASDLEDNSYAVVTDDVNNGIYRKNNGEWIFSDLNDAIGNQLGKKATALPIIAKNLSTFNLEDDNNLNLAWGVVDNANNVGIGLDVDGCVILSDAKVDNMKENSENYSFAIVDNDNSIAFGIKNDGTVDMPNNKKYADNKGNLAVIGNDIYHIIGNRSKKLTDTNNNLSATWLDANNIKFVSNRMGRFAEYTTNIDNLDTRLLYADNRKYEQIIVTGQSLAQGGANAAITTTPPYPQNAFKFENGPVGSQLTQVLNNLKPLSESQYETISTGFVNKLFEQAPDRTILMTGQAYGGAIYKSIKKNGKLPIFERCMQQVQYASKLGGGANVRALFLIHGEGDGNVSNANYDENLREMLDDYNESVKSINKQIDDIVMLTCQTSSASGYKDDNSRDSFVAPFLQLKASEKNADIVLVTPKYHFDYKDYAHIDAISTRLLGEYYAKVYHKVVIDGEPWQPLKPVNITTNDNKIIIDFYVPNPPIVFDTDLVTAADNMGFVLKNSNNVSITNVAITSESQITITLSANVPSNSELTYAFNNGTYKKSGRTQGARGNIRDSDTTQSSYNSTLLHNWCVIFKHKFGEGDGSNN